MTAHNVTMPRHVTSKQPINTSKQPIYSTSYVAPIPDVDRAAGDKGKKHSTSTSNHSSLLERYKNHLTVLNYTVTADNGANGGKASATVFVRRLVDTGDSATGALIGCLEGVLRGVRGECRDVYVVVLKY